MCGRYGSWSADAVVAQAFDAPLGAELEQLGPSWNVAPGADVRVLLGRPLPEGCGAGGDAPIHGSTANAAEAADAADTSDAANTADATGATNASGVAEGRAPLRDGAASVARAGRLGSLRAARWGLVPPWAEDASRGPRLINARSETAAHKPAFRAAMRSFRAVIPADCWYEWLRPDPTSGSRRATRAPYAVSRADGGILALAALCSWWRIPAPQAGRAPVRPGPAVHGDWLLTVAILTRDAGQDLAWLHHREPVVLNDEDLEAWLDPAMTEPAVAESILRRPRPPLTWHRVAPKVGSVLAPGPHLIIPVPEVGEDEPHE